MACGDRATAERIARHAPGEHRAEREHLEDFLYVHFLLQHFFLGAAPDTCEDIAARLTEASLEDVAATARADVCRALLTRNADGFQEALLTLIGEHRSWYETGFQRGRLPEEVWAIDGNLFIEGLALVRLARTVGLPTAEESPLIPSLALATPPMTFDAQARRMP